SHASELVNRHGAPDQVVVLGDIGTLWVYRQGERSDLALVGSERSSHIAYLVQNMRVTRASARVGDAIAQYYFFPFYELDRGPKPSVVGTVASVLVLAGLAFATGARLAR